MTKSCRKNLTDTQLVLLSLAAQRFDGAVVLPERLKGAAASNAVATLMEHGYVQECLAASDMPVWRRDSEERTFALIITDAGKRVIGLDDEASCSALLFVPITCPEATVDEAKNAYLGAVVNGANVSKDCLGLVDKGVQRRPSAPLSPGILPMPRAGSKIAAVIEFLERENGATIWAIFAAVTLGASIQSALIFNGIARVPANLAVLTVQSQVPFAVLAAWILSQERMNGRRLVGIAIALSGVALVVGMPGSVGEVGGLLLIVLGTLCWGFAQGIIRIFSRDPGGRLMGTMSVIAAPQLLILSLLLETGQSQALSNASLMNWVQIAILALGGFVAAYTIWYGLLRQYRVDQVAPFALLMPVVGVVTAFVILDERPSFLVLGGGMIILAGLGMVVYAPLSQDGRPK